MHYGYRRVHVLLRREGHRDNVKRVYRLYREEGLSLRLKRPRRNKAARLRLILPSHSRTRPMRNVAPPVQAEHGAFAQPIAA